MELPSRATPSLTRLAAIVYAAMVAVALLASWLLGINPWRVDLATTPWQVHLWAIVMGLGATLPLMGLLLLFEHCPRWWLARLRESVDHQVVPLLKGLSLAEFAFLSLCAGVGEELLFRGLIQTWLEHWLPPALPGGPVFLSIVIAGVFFGACHWINDQYALMAAIVGMYLGAEFVLADHLLAPIVTHAVYDFFALWYLTSRRSPPAVAGVQPEQSAPSENL